MRAVFLALCTCVCVGAQTVSLAEAVKLAAERYPSVRITQENVSAAAAGIQLARTAYLPRVDLYSQVNRATRNNIYGMLLPQATIAPISGPPVAEATGSSVFGTALGVHVAWEPFDFGLRKAGVDAAESARRHAEASAERTRFEVSAAAADAYLTVLAAQETVKAAEAGVRRAKVFEEAVNALVRAELRPGADASRARAEVAAAEMQRIHAEQAAEAARAELMQLTGARADSLAALHAPPEDLDGANPAHPLIKEQSAAIDEVRARQTVLDKSFFPKFQVQGAAYSRGTGANPDFTTQGGLNGLAPNFYNWGLGFSLYFPLSDYASLKAKKEEQAARERAEKARLNLIQTDLDARLAKGKAALEAARKIARQVPVQIEAARAAEQQHTARYRAGLGTIVEVAEAQRLLAQAEIDESLAKLNIWRAHLQLAAAQGDLTGFLRQAGGN